MPKIGLLACSLLLAPVLCGGISICRGEAVPAPQISANDPLSLQAAIKWAYENGLHRIVIPPGTYRVAAEPQSGSHLHFSGMKNFEIDATGATLIFTARKKSSFAFDHCEDVTLRGATLLRETPPFSQGKIIALSADRTTVDVQVSAGYPADFDDPRYFSKIWLNLYDRSTRQWRDDMSARANIERLGPDTFRFHSARALGGDIGWVVGAAVAWRGNGGPDIGLYACSGMKILDVTIKGGIGFCVYEGDGGGGNYYRYTVTYGAKPAGADEEPFMASNADGFHSNGVRKGPTLEGCHFEGMDDDGIPIHGQYALVEESQGNEVIVEARNPPFCEKGDDLRFLDARGVLAGEAKVVSTEILPAYKPSAPPPKDLRLFQNNPHDKYEQLTLDQPANAGFGWLVSNADANGAGFVIRNCTIRNNRARGMLIKASNGLIENCTIEGSSMGGIIIAPEMEYWNESDYARNVVVRNNVLRNCNYWSQQGTSQAGTITVAAADQHRFVPLPGGHRNIIIVGNTLEDNDGPNLVISSTEGIVVQDNHFIRPMWHANERGKAFGVDPGALIWLTESSGVQLLNNVLTEPGPYLQARIGSTSTVTGTGLQNGVSAP